MEINDIQVGVIYQLDSKRYWLKDKTKVKVTHKRTVVVEKTGKAVLTGWLDVINADESGIGTVSCRELVQI